MGILDEKHTDWPKWLRWVPRRWTAIPSTDPPKKLLGNQELTAYADGTQYPKPIPDPGQWQVSWPPYLAFTTKGGLSFRLGIRFDDVDNYYQVPAARLWKLDDPKKETP